MTILSEIKNRCENALRDIVGDGENLEQLLAMVRPTEDSRFGDYQANFAMPLKNVVGKPPREVAAEIVAALDVADMCEAPEVAGPGFINLRIQNEWLQMQLDAATRDERLGVEKLPTPRKYVIDFSSPNVAKPLHVGHIRSTIIGDAICRVLRFLGHAVISDNHLGDWGAQFGMVIYGYKHFRDDAAYQQHPLEELGRLYRLVRKLMDYQQAKAALGGAVEQLEASRVAVSKQEAVPSPEDKKERKKAQKKLASLKKAVDDAEERVSDLRKTIAEVEADQTLSSLAAEHPNIGESVLQETARLHEGDAKNVGLWEEFLPHCRQAIDAIYDRLDIRFDYEYGESFYQPKLAEVVKDLQNKGLAQESEGAICVFLEGFAVPMIVRKRDGAFLYATTDLATIKFRMEQWRPDAILYVVDHRQSQHFEMLFAAARQWGYTDVELQHVSFGTVLGSGGKPFKTRAGETVALEGLLDTAVQKAYETVVQLDAGKKGGPELTDQERRAMAPVVGIGALKYADLSQNRTSDYEFSYERMLSLDGNTATYMQYAYARIESIFAKGGVDIEQLRKSNATIRVEHPSERALALNLLRLGEALEDVTADYRPNLLTNWLYDTAKLFTAFYHDCHVLNAPTPELRNSRLLLCDLTARSICLGLHLLGIGVVEKM